MPLKLYNKKRNFKKTSEPRGNKKISSTQHLYLIQKHAASHLHYDLRLEMNGVLKSWAVPKGPSLDPSVKRLAVHVEDHPIEYGSFEGTIPAGEYGGGTVMLWDTGEWASDDPDPIKAYKKGHFTFILKGKRLKGLWKLIQIKKDPKNWLLMKVDDKYAKLSSDYDITVDKVQSVTTKKTMDEIGNKVKKNFFPAVISPQLATLVEEAPATREWLHETKFDGYRLICFVNKNNIQLLTRGHQDWTKKFPKIVKQLSNLKLSNTILDGEIVVLDKNHKTSFQFLQNTIHENQDQNIIYYIFDIIYFDGYDLSNIPLIERKKLLRGVIPSAKKSCLQFSEFIIGQGKEVFAAACKQSLEGIISKKINSPYEQRRTKNWLKVKCTHEQEFVVGGYTKPQGSRKHFGSLLIGTYSPNKELTYCGHVGTGFNAQSLKEMAAELNKIKSTRMPFKKRPPEVSRVTWVDPKLVIQVEFSEWTNEGILRHPSFKGMREDKPSNQVTKEIPVTIKKSSNLTHPDKILYPEKKITKQELADYYESIKEWILPYIIKRPLTLVRCPEGLQGECFYQKHINDNIKSIYSAKEYIYIKDIKGIMSLVQLGVLEIHTWNASINAIEKPDMIIFDLDPAPEIKWKKIVEAAYFIRDQLKSIKLKSFVKTTGGKGLHVVVPIKRTINWEQAKDFAEAFVKTIVSLEPQSYIDKMTKSKRSGKIYLDYLRNQRGATSIAPYSTRARENAPVAVPIAWDELPNIRPDSFTIKNLPQRLSQLKKDPWKDFFTVSQTLTLIRR